MVSKEVIESILFQSLKIKDDDKILIIYDETKKKIVEDIRPYLNDFGIDTIELEIKVTAGHGVEAVEEIVDDSLDCTITLIFTMNSLSHTGKIKKLRKLGHRVISMPLITEEIMNRSINIDYEEMYELNKKILDLYEKSNIVRIKKDKNELIIQVRNILNENGDFSRNGIIANLPCGEVHCGIEHEHTFGEIVIDQAIAGINDLIEPLTLQIENGLINRIIGTNSDELFELLNTYDEKGFKIAEFGIGTNPKARINNNPLELEKVKGTIHLGIGNDLVYGGFNDIPLHLDAITKNVEVYIGNVKIMENGKLYI